MGARKGAIAVRRYVILEPLPAKPRERLLKGLRAHVFMPLDPQSDLDRSAGWVALDDPDDTDLSLDKVFVAATGGEQLRVALRIDVLRPPAAEVKRQVRQRAQEIEAAEDRSLSKRELRTLKEEVTRELRRRAFPRSRVVDAVWNLDAGRLWLWSQTKAVNETFLDLFAKTFALRLDVEGPGRWARTLADDKTLAALEPTRELWMGFDGVRPLAGEAPEEEI